MSRMRVLLALTTLVDGSLLLDACSCDAEPRDVVAKLPAPPAFASASAWSNVCADACAPDKASGTCRFSVRSISGSGPRVTCLNDKGVAFEKPLKGEWQAFCSAQCGFSDFDTCTVDSSAGSVVCWSPACTGGAGRRPAGSKAGQIVSSSLPEFAERGAQLRSSPSGEFRCGRSQPKRRNYGRTTGLSAVGKHFARMAELEAASVIAFRRLTQHLTRLGAPAVLVQRAKLAESDEVRHTQRVTSLARKYGGRTTRRHFAKTGDMTLKALAMDNAQEGCVFETFGVLLALVAAKTSEDPAVRKQLANIAVEEARHAELSWAIADWAQAKLDPTSRGEVQQAQIRALRQLAAQYEATPPQMLVRIAGLPSREVAKRLIMGFERWVLTPQQTNPIL